MPEPAALPTADAPRLRLRQCARCSPGIYRRINRSTFLQRTVLTWLGFFPWECVCCRRKRLFRDAGRDEKPVPAGKLE